MELGALITRGSMRAGRLSLVAAAAGFLVGAAWLGSGPSRAIGGLCDGRPAGHTWLDVSGQYGPALLEGTKGDDVIVGGDGDDTIDGHGGDDVICGGAGNDSISVGPGGDSVARGGTGDDDVSAFRVHAVTLTGDGGDDTLAVSDTATRSMLAGGSGDDVLIHDGTGPVKADGGEGFDDCLIRVGDGPVDCEF